MGGGTLTTRTTSCSTSRACFAPSEPRVNEPTVLAAPLRDALGRLDRRLRRVAVVRGLGLLLALTALGIVLGMGLDFLFLVPEPTRRLLWAVGLATVGLAGGLLVLRPFTRRRDFLALAALAEARDPALSEGEPLTAAVGLASSTGAATPHGSSALIAAVSARAAALAPTIAPRRLVSGRVAVRRLVSGLILLGLAAAPALVTGPYRTLFGRVFRPWANLERPGRFHIEVTPGDHIAARGGSLVISVDAGPRPRILPGPSPTPEIAWLEWAEDQSGGGASSPRRLAMTPDQQPDSTATLPRRFSARIPRVSASLAYRVTVGPDSSRPSDPSRWLPTFDPETTLSRWYRITALDPPTISALTARIEPPAYTGRAAVQLRDPARLDAWQDSRISLDIQASTPQRNITVEFDPDPRTAPQPPARRQSIVASLAADRRGGTAALSAETSGTFSLTLTDDHELTSLPDFPRRLIVRPDAPPTVSLSEPAPEPGEGIEVRPDDVVRFTVEARDDVAVATAELHTLIERPDGMVRNDELGQADSPHMTADRSSREDRRPIEIEGAGTPSARGEAALALAALGLRPGDRLTYRVRVADNRPAPRGPNIVWTPRRAVVVSRRARPLAERRQEARRAALQAQLDGVKQLSAQLRQAAEQLRYAADAVLQGNGRWDLERQRQLTRRGEEAQELVDRLQLLARDVRDDPVYQPLAAPARQTASDQAQPARTALDQARRAGEPEAKPKPDPAGRLDALRQADSHLATVAARLEDLQARFDALAKEAGATQRPPVPRTQPDSGLSMPQPRSGPARGSDANSGQAQARSPGQSGNRPGRGAGKEAGNAGMSALQSLLKSGPGHVWGELPGHLRSQVLQTPSSQYRNEYSRQIQRYFRALAAPADSRDRQPP